MEVSENYWPLVWARTKSYTGPWGAGPENKNGVCSLRFRASYLKIL